MKINVRINIKTNVPETFDGIIEIKSVSENDDLVKEENNMCTTLKLLSGETANTLVEKYGLADKLPVSLNGLLKSCDIGLYSTDFKELRKLPEILQEEKEKGEILGAVAVIDNKLNIFYRNTDSVHRQKFTIAHELAHCCLDNNSLVNEGHIEFRMEMSEILNKEKEEKANLFAGQLLIPDKALKKFYEKIKIPDLNLLAEAFDVSVNVMRERLKKAELPFFENHDSELLKYLGIKYEC